MNISFSIIEYVSLFISILVIGTVVLTISNRFRLPFTVLVVLIGILLGNLHIYGPETLHQLATMHISPDLIYYICLPTLIFESAYNLDSKKLKENIVPVVALAIPGLLLSTFVIGLVVYLMTPLAFIYCLLLGAILSATDPVAVISIFKKLGAPKRLTVLVEGESLLNDATSIVTAHIILTIILAGVFTSHQIYHGVYEFFKEFIGGLIVGYITAAIAGFFLSKVKNNREIEISITTILAYATFIIAQDVVHVSGVTATVAAGLMMSVWGDIKISPEVMKFMGRFWEFLAYLANTIIFLVVGISVNLNNMLHHGWAIFSVIIAILIARALVIFGFVPLVRKIPGQPDINKKFQAVMYWGGLRGAISLAIVLSLGTFEHSELFLAMALGTVLFTMLVQGLTIEKLVTWLGLSLPPLSEQLAKLENAFHVKQIAMHDIRELQAEGMFSANIADDVYEKNLAASKILEAKITELKDEKITPTEELKFFFFECLTIEKHYYYELFTKGHFADKTYRRLIELYEARGDMVYANNFKPDAIDPFPPRKPYIRKLLTFLDTIPLLNILSNRYNTGRVALNYKVAWGLSQATGRALKHIDTLKISERKHIDLINQVDHYFKFWHELATSRLDMIAEQFPEFVLEMQTRLSERLELHAELQGIHQQIASGIIPTESAKEMKETIVEKIRSLSEHPSTHIVIGGKDNFEKSKLLAALPQHEFDTITRALKVRIYPVGDTLIKENEPAHTVYFILRGVVRLSHEEAGEEKEVATLFAGDTCGLLATQGHDKHYPVTCKTTTPCAIATLSLSDVLKFKQTCPAFANAIEKATEDRLGLLGTS